MADLKKTLDETQKKLEEERRQSDELGVEIDSEERETKPPTSKPDHANDGGII
jgi:hypothetical protein